MNQSAEIWKPVVGYEGIYEVSDLGRVKRVKPYRTTRVGRILKASPTSSGYISLTLHRLGSKNTEAIHCLVAAAFLGPCPKGMQINHIDLNKANNTVTNLEYVTPKGNTEHAIRMGARDDSIGEKSPHAVLTEAQVIEIRQLYAQGEASQRELAAMFGVVQSNIGFIVHGKSWKHLPSLNPIQSLSLTERRLNMARKRQKRGELSSSALLTESKIVEIRNLYAQGAKIRDLAKQYGVSPGTVGFAVSGETWKHVPMPSYEGRPRLQGTHASLAAAYRKGKEAALSGGPRPQNPYKRVDFAAAWDTAYDEAYLQTEAGKREEEARYASLMDDIPA